jgi:PAS domain S-box-containing protein
VLGLVMDVSAQKRAEQDLAERRDTLALASSAAGLLTWSWNPADNVQSVDGRLAAVLDLPEGRRQLTFDEWTALLHPDDVGRLMSLGADLVEGRSDSFDVVYRLRRPDGGWRWILDRGRVAERDAAGRALRVYGVALDVDERQRAEAELAEQRVRLRLALDSARLGLWDWDRSTRRLVVDERFCEFLGEPPEALADEPFLLERRLREADRQLLQEAIRACNEGDASNYSVLGRMLRRDGRTVDVLMQGAVSGRDPDGRPSRFTGVLADVTEAERARQLARMSEEVGEVGSYEIDLATEAIAWSEGTYRIFGMPASYHPDRDSTVALIAPSSRDRMRVLFRAARESGAAFDTELEVRRFDGSSAWIRMIGRVETFEGRPVRLYGIAQDISARKQLERELLEVANREQQRLGSELHDGLGQELAGVSMMLEALAQQYGTTQPSLRAQLDRLRGLITQSISSTRALAHGLAPVSLQRGGLENALALLAQQVRMAAGPRVTVDLAVESPLVLDEVAGTHLYRIAQEAVGNAMRHSSAKHVAIRLRSYPGALELEIVDDGIGLPPGGVPAEGFGLRSMRYRAQALEGVFWIGPGPRGGTCARIRCPLRR